MKIVGFIGVYDKTDLILNLAKIFTVLGSKVLIIDSTINQKAKYVVPTINPTTSYITNFEDIDVAIGFKNEKQIKEYLGLTTEDLPYDILLVDADEYLKIKEFKLEKAEKNFFVTSFDTNASFASFTTSVSFSSSVNDSKISSYSDGIATILSSFCFNA